jgi:CHAD domain-containing protein
MREVREDWKKKRDRERWASFYRNVLCFENSLRLQRGVDCNLGQSKSQLVIGDRYHVIAEGPIIPLHQVQILARHWRHQIEFFLGLEIAVDEQVDCSVDH